MGLRVVWVVLCRHIAPACFELLIVSGCTGVRGCGVLDRESFGELVARPPLVPRLSGARLFRITFASGMLNSLSYVGNYTFTSLVTCAPRDRTVVINGVLASATGGCLVFA